MKNILFVPVVFYLVVFLLPGKQLLAQALHAVALNPSSKTEVSTDSVKWSNYPTAMQMISATKGVVIENSGTLALYDVATGVCLKKVDFTKRDYKPIYKKLLTLNPKPHFLNYDSIMKVKDTLPFCTVGNVIFKYNSLTVPIYLLNRYTGPIPWKQHQKKYNFTHFFAIATLDTNLNIKTVLPVATSYPPFEPMDDPDLNNDFYKEVEPFGYIYIVINLITHIPTGLERYAQRYTSFDIDNDHYREVPVIGSKTDTTVWKNKRLFSKARYYFSPDSTVAIRSVMTAKYFTDSYYLFNDRDSGCFTLKNIYKPDSALIGKFVVSKDGKFLYYIVNDWDKNQQKFTGYLVKYDTAKEKSIGLFSLPAGQYFASLDFVDDKLVYTIKGGEQYYFATVKLP